MKKLICSFYSIFLVIPQNVLGVSSEELVGTLTNMVTFTRGEQIKRHYTKAMAEGECQIYEQKLFYTDKEIFRARFLDI